MTFGTEANAAEAIRMQAIFQEHRLDFGPRVLPYTDMLDPDDPKEWVSSQVEDWHVLGAGGGRAAWLCPDDSLVYKVPLDCRSLATVRCCTNTREWERYKEIEHLSNPRLPIRIPRTNLVTVGMTHVIVMEHIVGEFTWDVPEQRMRSLRKTLDVADSHSWNVLETKEGALVCVDFVA